MNGLLPPEFGLFIYAKLQLVLAGAFGGAVRWMTLRERPWPDGVISIVVGSICAVYLSPLAVPALEHFMEFVLHIASFKLPDTESISGLSGFLCGIGGITLSGFVIDMWRYIKSRVESPDSSDTGASGGGK